MYGELNEETRKSIALLWHKRFAVRFKVLHKKWDSFVVGTHREDLAASTGIESVNNVPVYDSISLKTPFGFSNWRDFIFIGYKVGFFE